MENLLRGVDEVGRSPHRERNRRVEPLKPRNAHCQRRRVVDRVDRGKLTAERGEVFGLALIHARLPEIGEPPGVGVPSPTGGCLASSRTWRIRWRFVSAMTEPRPHCETVIGNGMALLPAATCKMIEVSTRVDGGIERVRLDARSGHQTRVPFATRTRGAAGTAGGDGRSTVHAARKTKPSTRSRIPAVLSDFLPAQQDMLSLREHRMRDYTLERSVSGGTAGELQHRSQQRPRLDRFCQVDGQPLDERALSVLDAAEGGQRDRWDGALLRIRSACGYSGCCRIHLRRTSRCPSRSRPCVHRHRG